MGDGRDVTAADHWALPQLQHWATLIGTQDCGYSPQNPKACRTVGASPSFPSTTMAINPNEDTEL